MFLKIFKKVSSPTSLLTFCKLPEFFQLAYFMLFLTCTYNRQKVRSGWIKEYFGSRTFRPCCFGDAVSVTPVRRRDVSVMGRFVDGGRKWKVFLYVKIWKMCVWNMLFMSTWWPEIPRPGNNHVIECAMKGWCEWFRDMPVVTWPNIYAGLPTISKWTSSIADVFSWYLCGIYLWSCACEKDKS